MDDSEKLMALKKAYADIILNTAKEAAARIMVSERKALRSQQELASTKEEALRMLLRLKQMMDSKVKEAELTSLSQQKKIDELEAQLQEAEEIVRDLRAELSEARTELENLTNHQMHPPVEQNIGGEVATQENSLQENRLDPYDGSVHPIPGSQVESAAISDLKNPYVNGTNDSSKFCVPHDHTNNFYIHNPDFASIVIRKKEPELFRNGCTQRIRAFERSLFDGNMSVSGNLDNVHDETLDRVHEEGKAMPATTNAKANTPYEEKKPDELKVVKADADLVKNPLRKLRRSNKASLCVLETNDPSRVKSSIECENEAQKDLVRVHEESKVMPVPTNAKADTICEKERPDKLKVVEANADLVKVPVGKTSSVVIRLHPGEVKKTSKASYLSDAKGSACELDGNDHSRVNSSTVHENEVQKDIMSSFTEAPKDKTTTIEQSGSHHDIEKGQAFINNACNTSNKIKDEEELFDKSDLTRQESLSTESLEVPACRADVEEANGSPGKLDPKASDLDAKVSCQSANDKFLKYTFQRKRKKESVTSADIDCSLENCSLKQKCGEKQNGHVEPQKSCPMTVTSADVDCSLENRSLKKSGEKQNGHVEPQKSCTVTGADVDCSLENRSLKKKCGEKQNGHVEPQKSCPMTESSRDSRRLAQVARQLISLSGKKW